MAAVRSTSSCAGAAAFARLLRRRAPKRPVGRRLRRAAFAAFAAEPAGTAVCYGFEPLDSDLETLEPYGS